VLTNFVHLFDLFAADVSEKLEEIFFCLESGNAVVIAVIVVIVLCRHLACCSGINTTLKRHWQTYQISLHFQMSGLWRTKCCLSRHLIFMARASIVFDRWYV